ncbi:MAG TPA: GNAT family N-acetyltransferase [Rhizomicrobium sp.]|nr:GNAT family N-acetyltransferase [Rhizomicrobium sp.]
MPELVIRNARAGEEDLILALMRELAEYEKLLDVFRVTAAVIRRDYFGARPLLNCDLAFEGDEAAGIATWYWKYSSFAATRAIYLEDLFVRPAFRGKGYGKALLAHLAKAAVGAGANAVDWSVLDWNQPSIDFYEGIGARRNAGWYVYRLEGDALKALGK